MSRASRSRSPEDTKKKDRSKSPPARQRSRSRSRSRDRARFELELKHQNEQYAQDLLTLDGKISELQAVMNAKISELQAQRQGVVSRYLARELLIKANQNPQTVFLFDINDKNPVFSLAVDNQLVATQDQAPVHDAVKLINAHFRYVDLKVTQYYSAAASCCEGEPDVSLKVSYKGEEVLVNSPETKDWKVDTQSAHTETPQTDYVLDKFDKSMFSGCGLDRLQASTTVDINDDVIGLVLQTATQGCAAQDKTTEDAS